MNRAVRAGASGCRGWPDHDVRPHDGAADARRLRHAIRTLLGCISLNVELLRLTRAGRDDVEALDAIARAVEDITALLSAPPGA